MSTYCLCMTIGRSTSPGAVTDLAEAPTVPLADLAPHTRTCGRPRNTRNEPPPPPPRRVLADAFSVGDRFRGGSVSGGVRDGEVWVNCALLGSGVTVDLSPAQAEVFAAHLAEWARRARARE
jgi:hypothetical protein